MTAATVAPGKRAARWNPTNPRHSWSKDEEHHKTCQHCGMHVENRQGARHRWFQLWTWPGRADRAAGNTYDGAKLPVCPGPGQAPTVVLGEVAAPAAAPEPVDDGKPVVTCPTCGDELDAIAATVICVEGRVVRDDEGKIKRAQPTAIAARDPHGPLVVVKIDDEWFVRAILPGEQVPPLMRRRRHVCIYRHKCYVCGSRAKLFAGGTYCDCHSPGGPTCTGHPHSVTLVTP